MIAAARVRVRAERRNLDDLLDTRLNARFEQRDRCLHVHCVERDIAGFPEDAYGVDHRIDAAQGGQPVLCMIISPVIDLDRTTAGSAAFRAHALDHIEPGPPQRAADIASDETRRAEHEHCAHRSRIHNWLPRSVAAYSVTFSLSGRFSHSSSVTRRDRLRSSSKTRACRCANAAS